eukprot:1195289-Prorocentrum_minimum.AAC.4
MAASFQFDAVEPRGDVGYRVEITDLDDPSVVVPTLPAKVWTFVSNRAETRDVYLNRAETYFTDFRYRLTGLDFRALIKLEGVSTFEQLLYCRFHVVELTGPDSQEDLQQQQPSVQAVYTTEMFEFNNGVERDFPVENFMPDRYYYVFFNVYTTENDETTVVYSSVNDYRLVGFNPVTISRMTMDITQARIDSTLTTFDVTRIDTMEPRPELDPVYKITVHATPVQL